MNIHIARNTAGREEIDYLFLIGILQEYIRPREKISAWLKSGELIRVKKGLYVFGKTIAKEPFSKEILANLIYGPSAVSLTYALSFYGLIPERTSIITSITNKRNKKFATPVGNYIYYYLNNEKYTIGLEFSSQKNGRPFLIATPEKALCDQLCLIDRKIKITEHVDMKNYLIEDLRLDEDELKKFSLNHLIQINDVYKNIKIQTLISCIKKWKK